MGATFKEDVSDIRNSKVADIITALRNFSVEVDVVDPHAESEELEHEYGFGLAAQPQGNYDAVIVAVAHAEYKSLTATYFSQLMPDKPILVDLKSLYNGMATNGITYWCL
jgi:UDP-N-acetyl-D-galactosamine dehydrogenase